jgi:hypothetical protein
MVAHHGLQGPSCTQQIHGSSLAIFGSAISTVLHPARQAWVRQQ